MTETVSNPGTTASTHVLTVSEYTESDDSYSKWRALRGDCSCGEWRVRKETSQESVRNQHKRHVDLVELAEKDWTVSPTNGRPNTSAAFRQLTQSVQETIVEGASLLISGGTEEVAKQIVAKLAHEHGLAPKGDCKDCAKTKEELDTWRSYEIAKALSEASSRGLLHLTDENRQLKQRVAELEEKAAMYDDLCK